MKGGKVADRREDEDGELTVRRFNCFSGKAGGGL